MAGISYSGDGDINVSNVDMSSTDDSPSSSPVAKPDTSGSSGPVNNGIVCRNGHVNITGDGQVVMGSNNRG